MRKFTYLSNIAIFNIFFMFFVMISFNNNSIPIQANIHENADIIKKYEDMYNDYFNKRMDVGRATMLYDLCDALAKEYEKNGDYISVVDALNRQVKYAKYIGEDENEIYKQIELVDKIPSLYVFSKDPKYQVYNNQKNEPATNIKYIGIAQQDDLGKISDSDYELASVDVSFLNQNIQTIAEKKYQNLYSTYSSIYINFYMNTPTEEILQNLTQDVYKNYMINSLNYLNHLNTVLDKEIFLNLSFNDISGIHPDTFNDVYKYFSEMIGEYASDIALIYNHIDNEKYKPSSQYYDWVGTNLTLNSGLSTETSEEIRLQISELTKYNKPIFVSNLTVYTLEREMKSIDVSSYTKSVFNETSAVNGFRNLVVVPSSDLNKVASEEMNENKVIHIENFINILFPEIKGIVFNNRNGNLDKSIQSIAETYLKDYDYYDTGSYIKAEQYKYNDTSLKFAMNTDVLENEELQIIYSINGTVYKSSNMPYSFELDASNLEVGSNFLTINFLSEAGHRGILNYEIQKSFSNQITILDANVYNNEKFVKPSSYQLDVEAVLQYPELPTGCEITALTTLLNYLDYDVSKTTMATDFMKRGPIGTTNPLDAFVGDPEVINAYGCHAPVIVNAANDYFASIEASHRAYDITGSTYEQLTDYVARGYPVLVWETMYMKESAKVPKWSINGSVVYWIESLHCVVLTGYTETTYTIADPLVGVITHNRSLVEKRYDELGRQAIIITDDDLSSILE